MAVIQGLDELDRKLKRLSLEVQRKGLMKATKEGGEIIRAEMERTAPRLTGHLAENEIVSAVNSQSNAFVAIVRIGPARDAFYGQFPEFGTAFMIAEPFVMPSFQSKQKEALAAAGVVLKVIVEGAS